MDEASHVADGVHPGISAGKSPAVGSFRLHLAADGKAARTVRDYTGAVTA